jgi:hypothetical protein
VGITLLLPVRHMTLVMAVVTWTQIVVFGLHCVEEQRMPPTGASPEKLKLDRMEGLVLHMPSLGWGP